MYGLTGGLLNNSILLCGGSDHQDNVSDRCFALRDLQRWEEMPSLKLYVLLIGNILSNFPDQEDIIRFRDSCG